jgi:hypothetical protein
MFIFYTRLVHLGLSIVVDVAVLEIARFILHD